MSYPEVSKLRKVRSYMLRQGRMTEGQRKMLSAHWQRYGIEQQKKMLDLEDVFGRSAPCIVEIGFGMGSSLLQMATDKDTNDYLGIEVHKPGIACLLRGLVEQEIMNVRVMRGDAVEILEQNIRPSSLSAVHLYFPDPWPKTRHRRRRIVQSAFINVVVSRLQVGGVFHMATDWKDYARQAMSVLTACTDLTNQAGNNNFSSRPVYRPLTKFEKRGQNLGHGVWDLIFTRQ